MREIVLDTETTGFDPAKGHRIVEIGCVELVNLVPSGKTFHVYLNPEMPMPDDAAAVHGLTDAFLADKPVFAAVVDDFLRFIAADQLVIHNATFDMNFINYELKQHGFAALPSVRALDTVQLARKKFPGQKNSLDALCDRFNIDKSNRTLHGALLDARLLAEVYLELCGGREPGLSMDGAAAAALTVDGGANTGTSRAYRAPRSFVVSEAEQAAHAEFLQQIKNPLWTKERKNS